MTNIRWGVTLGVIAALISVTLGIIFGVRMADILIRAVIFFFVFFAMGAGIRFMINNFLPELLYLDNGQDSKIDFDQPPPPGSQINISLGSEGEYAVPELYRDSRDSEELGNIEDLISGHFRARTTVENDNYEAPVAPEQASGGIDLTTEDDYNTRDSFSSMPQEFASFKEPELESEPAPSKPVAFEKPAFTPVFGGDSDDLGALPDLGAMSSAFSTGFDDMEATAMPSMGDAPADSTQTQYNKGNKAQPLEGDFNPQELAQGIRTVLSKDQGR